MPRYYGAATETENSMRNDPPTRQLGSDTYRILWMMVIWMGMWILCPNGAGAADQVRRSYADQGPFRYAMVHVLGGVNLEDAKIAVKVNWSKHLANVFPGMASEFEILSDAQSAAKMIADNKLHGLSLGIVQFLELSKTVRLNPVFISSRLNTPLESYLLVVRKDSDWESLGGQTNRRLVIEKTPERTIGQMWLETLLSHHKLSPARTYFTQITSGDKPTRIVLPVFFGQADACLVSESAYHTMAELNPQIGRRLTVLARSPGFIKTINCTTELMPRHMVERFVKKGVPMTDTVDGRQLLLIFHVKKNFVFQPEYLTDSERIYREYQQITASSE